MTSITSMQMQGGAGPIHSGSLTSVICQQAVRTWTEWYGNSMRALVLTGSLARNEGTFVGTGANPILMGDAEFVLVLRDKIRLPSDAVTADLCRRVESALRQAGLSARVSAAVVHDDFLRRMKPQMFAYELRTCGKVIWGESRILELVPPFAASEIGLEDAWRTLCNRSIEALEAIADADTDQATVPSDVFYRVVKLYLDMATSLLLFVGGYEPGYAKRAQRLSSLAAQLAGTRDIPIPLGDLSREVAACTNWKLFPDRSFEQTANWCWCMLALGTAARLWRWELLQLSGAPDVSGNEQLMSKGMLKQPFTHRLRGWLYAWRACGWLRSTSYFLRWSRLARKSSPRYWIYLAAGELLWHAADRAKAGDSALQRCSEFLPLASPPRSQTGRTAWAQVAQDVARNYHQFLEHTRA